MASSLQEDFFKECRASCSSGDVSGVQAALAKGVDVNAVNENGKTAFYDALAGCGQTPIFDLFLDHPDIDINKANTDSIWVPYGSTPLHAACQRNRVEVI